MMMLIDGLPPQVLGVKASGRVTHSEYREVLVPRAEAMIASGPIGLLYVIGKDFAGYENRALRDDGAFGIRHWRDFRRIAVVGDQNWVRKTVTLLQPFAPCEVRVYSRIELAAASAWVSGAEAADV
jgi:hypothetical protein